MGLLILWGSPIELLHHMKVIFHKTSHERYTLECIRDDGNATRADDLEAKSTIRHDLMHFVFESRAKLRNSFYGLVASGKAIDELAPQEDAQPHGGDEARRTEMLVGVMQGAALQDPLDPDKALAIATNMCQAHGEEMPAFLTADLVRAIVTDYKQLVRQWEDTKTGDTLALEFSE